MASSAELVRHNSKLTVSSGKIPENRLQEKLIKSSATSFVDKIDQDLNGDHDETFSVDYTMLKKNTGVFADSIEEF